MKLSIVILCWNDRKVIADCLRSIYDQPGSKNWEVIVSDNGSSDGSPEFVRQQYPQALVIENRRNLRFAKANNVGIRACHGEYVLILNPDTIIHDGALDTMLKYADARPEVGAFGCRVLNADGSYQISAQPFPSIRNEWISALRLRWLGHLSAAWEGDTYAGWKGDSERQVDWITGCFMLIRSEVLQKAGGFDEQFFYYYEDTDLCRQIRQAGYPIAFTPSATITHLKGVSTSKRLPPLTFALDAQITRYLYYYKYFGRDGVKRARRVALLGLALKRAGYGVLQLVKPDDYRKRRLQLLHGVFQWNLRVDPVRLVEKGEEPTLDLPLTGRLLER